MSLVYQQSTDKFVQKKVYTCQDLESELFMEQDFNRPLRCSTPVNVESGNFLRNRENFITLWLHFAATEAWSSLEPPAFLFDQFLTPSSNNLNPPGNVYSNVMLNRLRAEALRKQCFGKIYSGPISNSSSHRRKF